MSELSLFPKDAAMRLVEEALIANSVARDSDALLYKMVLLKLRGVDYLRRSSVDEFLTDVEVGVVPSYDTVKRYRRLIQQHSVAMRGSMWLERHQQEKAVVEALRERDGGGEI